MSEWQRAARHVSIPPTYLPMVSAAGLQNFGRERAALQSVRVLASHQARERLLSKCNEQGIAGLSDFMKEGRLLCCKSESLSCCWFAFMSCCVAALALFGSARSLCRSKRSG